MPKNELIAVSVAPSSTKNENNQNNQNNQNNNEEDTNSDDYCINFDNNSKMFIFDSSSNDISNYLENTKTIRNEIAFLTNFSKFSDIINDAYIGSRAYNSITLDLIALYLKGQKIIYIESKTFCEQCLYSIMLPTIFISTVCTVLSISLELYKFGPLIVSSLTAFNSFLLALITYLKLDAKSNAHKTSAYQFDKLQTTCEFLSGKVLLIKDSGMQKDVTDFVETVEKKVEEIKDTNQFIIPELIRLRYSTIYSHNIFSIVKQFRTKYLLDKNKLLLLYKKIENQPHNNIDPELIKEKNELLQNIIKFRDISLEINNDLYSEIDDYNKNRKNKSYICMWLKT